MSNLDANSYDKTSLKSDIESLIDNWWDIELWGNIFAEFNFYIWPFGQGSLVNPTEMSCKYTLPDIGNIDYKANKGYPDTKSEFFPFFEYYQNPDNRKKTNFSGQAIEYWTSSRNHAVAAQAQYKSINASGKENGVINTSKLWVSPIMVI